MTDLLVRFMLLLNAQWAGLVTWNLIQAAYDPALVQEALGRIEVDVITASEIDAVATLARIGERIKAVHGEGAGDACLLCKPIAIIGGSPASVSETRLLDGSVATKLRKHGYTNLRAEGQSGPFARQIGTDTSEDDGMKPTCHDAHRVASARAARLRSPVSPTLKMRNSLQRSASFPVVAHPESAC